MMRPWLALVLLPLVLGCVAFRTPYTGGPVRGGETVLVGRFELVPPLQEGEQQIQAVNADRFKNRVQVIAGHEWREINGEPTDADYVGGIDAALGQHFWVVFERRPLFLMGGSVYLKVGMVVERAYLPGGFRVDVQAGDEAVYIGTLRYLRDEFWNIRGVQVIDELALAESDFRARFPAGPVLRKRLAVPLNAPAARVRSRGIDSPQFSSAIGPKKDRCADRPQTERREGPRRLVPGSERGEETNPDRVPQAGGVEHHWLVDSDARTLTVYRLENGRWSELGVWGDESEARIEPFVEASLDVGAWWF